jgi:molybdenum cofactor biosynthesis protein B
MSTMSDTPSSLPRFVVATVAPGRASVKNDVAQIVIDEVNATRFAFVRNVPVNRLVRSVTVNRERQFIEQLVTNLANSNQADVIILIGGVGLGPRDYTCEAVDALADHRIEGFGEAFRRLMREDLNLGIEALVARATAGVCNRCLVVALPRQPEPVRRAIRELVLPTVAATVRVASGGVREISP